jgi:hypothetical protein
MVKLSELIQAAESASPEALARALDVLRGFTEEPLLNADEVAAKLRVSRKTIYRHAKPRETLARKHYYSLEEVRKALAS